MLAEEWNSLASVGIFSNWIAVTFFRSGYVPLTKTVKPTKLGGFLEVLFDLFRMKWCEVKVMFWQRALRTTSYSGRVFQQNKISSLYLRRLGNCWMPFSSILMIQMNLLQKLLLKADYSNMCWESFQIEIGELLKVEVAFFWDQAFKTTPPLSIYEYYH